MAIERGYRKSSRNMTGLGVRNGRERVAVPQLEGRYEMQDLCSFVYFLQDKNNLLLLKFMFIVTTTMKKEWEGDSTERHLLLNKNLLRNTLSCSWYRSLHPHFLLCTLYKCI